MLTSTIFWNVDRLLFNNVVICTAPMTGRLMIVEQLVE
jgi:hypothetical protein